VGVEEGVPVGQGRPGWAEERGSDVKDGWVGKGGRSALTAPYTIPSTRSRGTGPRRRDDGDT
jgi:hypothetical protein